METGVHSNRGYRGSLSARDTRQTVAIRWWHSVLLGMALVIVASSAWAGELSLLINGYTHHINPPEAYHYNERNWGGGFQYDYDRVYGSWVPFIAASGLRDSFRENSYYAGGGMQRRFEVSPSLDNLHVDLGLVAFVMTRKDIDNNHPFLGLLPAATIGTDHVSLNITYVPPVHPKLIPLWFFQLKVPLKKF